MIRITKSKDKFKNRTFIEDNKPIVLVAGGTGGHIVPAMRVASDLIKTGKKVVFITDTRFNMYQSLFLKYRFFSSDKFRIIIIPVKNFGGSTTAITFLLDAMLSFVKCLFFIFKEKPKIFIGFGGYVSFIPLLSALLTFKNIIIHEQNAVFGKVNSIFIKYASSVLFSFPEFSYIPQKQYKAIQKKLIISGLPNFLDEEGGGKSAYKIIHDISVKDEIVILITGGGQGATFFSFNIPPAIILLAKSYPGIKFKIFHQVRENEMKLAREIYKNAGLANLSVIIESLFKDIPSLLLIADFAIIRGGAASIIEAANSRVFPIVIPMPNSAGGHQIQNAKILAKNNAGVMISQNEYTPEKLALVISKAISDGLFYFPIINSASELFKKNSTDVFLNLISYNNLDFVYYGDKK